jgi:hypothetical protein
MDANLTGSSFSSSHGNHLYFISKECSWPALSRRCTLWGKRGAM